MNKNFTVDRSFWHRGGWRLDSDSQRLGHGGAALRNDEGNACCLGHIANQCGLPWSELDGVELPGDLRSTSKPPLYGVLIDFESEELTDTENTPNSDLVNEAAGINDNSKISDSEREEKLTELFLKSGIALTFHGEYLGGFLAKFDEQS